MIETTIVFIALVLAVGGVGAFLNGYRVYSEAERSRAGELWTVYGVATVLESVVGVTVLLWIALDGLPTVWLLPALPVVQIPVSLVQWRMHQAMEFESRLGGWLSQGV